MSQEDFSKVSETEKPIVSDKEQVKRMSPEERKKFKNVLNEICRRADELAEDIKELDPKLAQKTKKGCEQIMNAYDNVLSDIRSEKDGD